MKQILKRAVVFLSALGMSAGLAQAGQYIWTGASNGSWNNGANYSGGVAHPNDSSGDWLDFVQKGGGANNNMVLEGDRRTGGIAIRDAWKININGRTLRADWVSVDFTTGSGTGVIEGGGNFQSYNSFSWNAAAGDTLVINCYYKPTGSNNRNNTIGGGGTVALNNSIDHDNKQMNFTVSGGTTFINNWWIGTASAGSITVASDSRYAGKGSTGVAIATINGAISPSSGGDADAGVGTLSFNNALTINGTYAADITATNCDKVAVTGALTLGGSSKVVVSGTSVSNVYVIASYTSLSGTFNAGTSVIPSGYAINYAYSGNQIAVVKLLPPNAPTGFSATASTSAGQINLAWTDASTDETGFKVERTTDLAGSPDPANWTQIATPAANATSYNDTGLPVATKYHYRVRATNATGDSDWAGPASATTLSAPAAPTGLSATAASAIQINLAWTDASSNETGFKIERAPDVGGTPGTWAQIATPAANATSYNDSGLTASTTYHYRVLASNAAGDSTWAGPVSGITHAPPATPPDAPTGLSATPISHVQIDLAWTDASDNEDGFVVERAPDVSGAPGTWALLASLAANATSYSDTGLTGSTTYHYRVRAYNTGYDSVWAGPASATTAVTPPAAPTGVSATAVSPQQIDLAWTDASSNEDGFAVERAPDVAGVPGTWAPLATLAANATSYSDTGLATATTYHYRTCATNAGGSSAWAGPVSATTFAVVAPSGLSATAASAVQIDLTWTDNSSDETGFKIERAPDVVGNPGTWAQVATVGAGVTSFLSTGLSPSTKYHFRVRAYNGSGNSSYSAAANATTPTGTANNGFTWTGMADGSWVNVNNWLLNGAIPVRYPGNGYDGDVVYFGGKNVGASNPASNQSRDDRVSSLNFQNAWELNLGVRWLRMDGVSVDIPGVNGTARIYGGSGLQSYNSLTFSAAAGDTLVLDSYFKPTGSNNRTENFSGGGTIAVNGGFDNDNKTITYNVQGNTTLLNNTYVNSTGGNTGSITVDAGSTAAGSGNYQVLISTVNGTVSPSTGNANTGISTLTFSGALNINSGTYAADVTAASCDKVAVTGALTLGANSQLVVSGTASAKVYEIATYTSLSGTFNMSTSVLPPHYKLDYAYNGENKIALVKQPYGTIMTFY